MAGYTTMNSFFDESGKFKDHKIICFGGLADYEGPIERFAREWGQLLFINGLTDLSAKKVFNPTRPLSDKNKNVGVKKRIKDLLPFIVCIRKHIQIVTGVTVDVQEFKKLPSHFFKSYGTDPSFMAFARSMLHLVDYTPSGDKINFICDDDEETALPFYRLYRRVRKVWPKARNRMVGISFVDDRYLFALQGADFVASIMRLESGRLWLRAPYDYVPLFKALTRNPTRDERLWSVDIAFGDKPTLLSVAEGLEKARKDVEVEG